MIEHEPSDGQVPSGAGHPRAVLNSYDTVAEPVFGLHLARPLTRNAVADGVNATPASKRDDLSCPFARTVFTRSSTHFALPDSPVEDAGYVARGCPLWAMMRRG
jgi:hypothetical protein